jgi:hypothetical protein
VLDGQLLVKGPKFLLIRDSIEALYQNLDSLAVIEILLLSDNRVLMRMMMMVVERVYCSVSGAVS